MKKFASLLLLYLGLQAISPLAVAQGNLIINGGFNQNANGWTIINTPGGFGYSSVEGKSGGGVLLDNISPSPSSDPSASQSLNSLTPGWAYLVSGDFCQGKDRGGSSATTPSFGVLIDGNVLFTALASGNYSWQHFSFFYTASYSHATLSLSSQMNGMGVSYAIDNISVQAVPEPHSLILYLPGAWMLLHLYRRHRPNVASTAFTKTP